MVFLILYSFRAYKILFKIRYKFNIRQKGMSEYNEIFKNSRRIKFCEKKI